MLAIKDNLPTLIETTAQSTKEIVEEINSFMPEFITIGLQLLNALRRWFDRGFALHH